MKKVPCCGRTLYIYLTKVITDANHAHLTHYTLPSGKQIHVKDVYKAAMSSERRRNNDIFGRSSCIQVKYHDEWVPVKVCQILLCYMIHSIRLFDYINTFLPYIKQIMKKDEARKQEKKNKSCNLKKKDMISSTSLDFHMCDENAWKIMICDEEVDPSVVKTESLDFYMN